MTSFSSIKRKYVGTATFRIMFDDLDFILKPGVYELEGDLTRLRKLSSKTKNKEVRPILAPQTLEDDVMEGWTDFGKAPARLSAPKTLKDDVMEEWSDFGEAHDFEPAPTPPPTKKFRLDPVADVALTSSSIKPGKSYIRMATYDGPITREMWEADPADSYEKWGYSLGMPGDAYGSDGHDED